MSRLVSNGKSVFGESDRGWIKWSESAEAIPRPRLRKQKALLITSGGKSVLGENTDAKTEKSGRLQVD
jgi:hypothetical protein